MQEPAAALCASRPERIKNAFSGGGGGRHESCVRFGIAVGTVGVECDKRLRR